VAMTRRTREARRVVPQPAAEPAPEPGPTL
jgi:hypothetical protein